MKPLLVRTAIVLGLCACSSAQQKRRSVVDEVNEGNISVATVLDLARSSYLKGCVDGKNEFAPEKRSESAFDPCLMKAKEHQEEIRYILEQNPAPLKKKK